MKNNSSNTISSRKILVNHQQDEKTPDKGSDCPPNGFTVDTPSRNTPEKTDPQNVPEAPLPAFCPKCGEPLIWEGVHLICPGSKCIAKSIVSIAYFYSNKGIMIDGIGEGTIEKLLENQRVFEVLSTKPWALLDPITYNISIEVYSILGETIFTNIIKQIHQVNRTKTMAHFISGLGLPGLSYKTALRLCQYIKSGKLNIPISDKAKKSFFNAAILFNEAHSELKTFSFAPLPEYAKAIYCITGTLSQSREAMIEIISEYGYEFSSAVTRETNYLLVGQEAGKVKIDKALKYNIPRVTEEQFFKILNKEN